MKKITLFHLVILGIFLPLPFHISCINKGKLNGLLEKYKWHEKIIYKILSPMIKKENILNMWKHGAALYSVDQTMNWLTETAVNEKTPAIRQVMAVVALLFCKYKMSIIDRAIKKGLDAVGELEMPE